MKKIKKKLVNLFFGVKIKIVSFCKILNFYTNHNILEQCDKLTRSQISFIPAKV